MMAKHFPKNVSAGLKNILNTTVVFITLLDFRSTHFKIPGVLNIISILNSLKFYRKTIL